MKKAKEKEQVGLARTEFNRVLEILNKNGYTSDLTLYDFWRKNEDELVQKVYSERQTGPFEHQVFWYSPIGQVIQTSVRDYLKEKDKRSALSRTKVEADFSDWKFTLEGKTVTIKDYYKRTVVTKNAVKKDLLNFSGIDLSGINLNGLIIKNCSFEYAFFDKARLDSIDFQDSMLDGASFYKSWLNSINLNGETTFRSVYLDGAFVQNLENLNDDTVSVPFIYTEISYWWIVNRLLKRAINKEVRDDELLFGSNHTTFLNNNAERISLPHLKELKEYINWFQSLIGKLYNFQTLEWKRRIGFFLASISTKYWSSFFTLGAVAFIIDLLFAVGYFFNSTSFHTLDIPANCAATFVKAFYYSTVTFMTLGYGDVFPKYWGGQLAVIFEVSLGYTVLGLFVYLVSRKVDKMY